MIGAGDRADKIRTYNFPQDRLTDHRVGLDLSNLPRVMDGELDRLIDTLITTDQAEQLKVLVGEEPLVAVPAEADASGPSVAELLRQGDRAAPGRRRRSARAWTRSCSWGTPSGWIGRRSWRTRSCAWIAEAAAALRGRPSPGASAASRSPTSAASRSSSGWRSTWIRGR